MTEQRNLILAIVISVAILMGFQFAVGPKIPTSETGTEFEEPLGAPAVPKNKGAEPVSELEVSETEQAEIVAQEQPRILINPGNPAAALTGSIRLQGARIDQIILEGYRESIAQDSSNIVLFSSSGSARPYFAEFGWVAEEGANVKLPGPGTMWHSKDSSLSPDRPVLLTWENGEGLRFERLITVDDKYMFTVTDRVRNITETTLLLYPYGLIRRTHEPETLGFFILHEGPLGVFNDTLKEIDYDELRDSRSESVETTGGWIGITDKYWLAALIPDQTSSMRGRFRYREGLDGEKFQVEYRLAGTKIGSGETVEVTNHLFAGAKVVTLLDHYEEALGIQRFDLAVDFGWFYFLTKPLFYLIHYLTGYLGNIGLAILSVTVIIKLIFFPLANKSYAAMSRLKKLQPQMMKLREQYGDDKVKLNTEMMGLYKKEGANPLAGCLPIVIQIPVFFALYKVLFVTIEMRHAPFYGWIKDLSAPDPTTFFNLFGVLPYTPPEFLIIGIWPLAMGVTMWMQQKLNPAPPDPMQARIMMLLPIVFTFICARFASGLVIYWTWNNILSIIQQWVIMRRMGVKA
ncbi:MAG: membrane protein insertase YidC [Pseudomonadota bacterium]|nr:membrane protein insertase YidC [Pseudomonadota bacterium]